MNEDPEKREELQGVCSSLSGGERCELRQVRLAGQTPGYELRLCPMDPGNHGWF